MIRKKKKDEYFRHKMLVSHNNPHANIAEKYRMIRNNIQFSTIDSNLKTLLVTSPTKNNGNTTTLVNLGLVFAQQDQKVLLVDTDLRKPSLHQLFKHDNRVGLTNALLNTSPIEECISNTTIYNMDILTSGPLPSNPSELLGSKKMQNLVQELQHYYNFLLFDSPPILDFSDTQILANLCDGSILVLKSGASKKEDSILAVNSLLDCKTELVGAVLNQKK